MKLRAFPFILGALLLLSGHRIQAQVKPSSNAGHYAISTRVYRLLAPELEIGIFPGGLNPPALPPPNARTADIETFLRRSHNVIKDYLIQHGVTLPNGSLACFDPASSTLALRAMSVVHDQVEPLVASHLNQSPKNISWTLEMVEVPEAAGQASILKAVPIANHQAVLESLLSAGKSVLTMSGETKSGLQTSAHQGSLSFDPLAYSADDKHRVEYVLDEQKAGTLFEMESTVGSDAGLVNVNFALSHAHNSGVPRWDRLTDGSSEKIEVQWIDRPVARMKSSISMAEGTTRLLGVWALDGETSPSRRGLVRVAFLSIKVIKFLPPEEPRVEQILRANGESVSPTLRGVLPPADTTHPPGMEVRIIRVPPDFLSVSSATPDTSPTCATNGVAVVGAPQTSRRFTAEEILRAQAIPFPVGSSAKFNTVTSELVVANTPENLDLIADFANTLIGEGPRNTSFSFYIIQADGGLIRKIERDALHESDHTVGWRSAEDAVKRGAAKFIRSATLTTKSGQSANTESIIEYIKNTGVSYSGKVSAARISQPEKVADAASPVAKDSATSNNEFVRLSTSAELQPVGLRIEIEPSVNPDGRTLELNLAFEYDFAPPVLRVSTEPVPEGTQRVAAPSTEFRKVETKASTTLLSGSTRMISVWKPSGTPELDGDILQALFIRADIVPVEPTEK
jgi:hypothetical protein